MTHGRFARQLAFDVIAVTLVGCVLVGVAIVAPDWVVGVVALVLLPAVVIRIVVSALIERPLTDTDRCCSAVDVELDAAESRRREESSSWGAELARDASWQFPAAAAPNKGQARPVHPSAGRAARPDVVTAYVDLAWATHDASMHSYRVTRPGR